MTISDYLVPNIPLFSISMVMIFIAIRNINVRRKESIYFLLFTTIVLLLSAVVFMEKYSMTYGHPILGTIFSSLGYIFRPLLLYLFVLLANMEQKRSKLFYIICSIPLIINVLVYIMPLFFNVPVISKLVFYYELNPNGTASFERGTFLNFTSHFISFIYAGLLIYVSTMRFQGKHKKDGIVLILCVVIILATVIAEMLTDRTDLLNVVSEICVLINYVFIISVNTSRDPLTGLYDRRTYVEDLSKYENTIVGVIVMDMNELKYLNDNYGHVAGDNALIAISKCLNNSVDSNSMCCYRLSGDEFLILMFKGKKAQLDETVNKIKENMSKTDYTIALGDYYLDKNVENISFHDMLAKAEKVMYKDKADFYKQSGHDRRVN